MKILIATNHSYMFYRFRKELVEALMQEHEVILSTPFVGHEDDLQAMGLRCIETDIDRRSINPFKDMKLLKTYRQMLDELQPDMVVIAERSFQSLVIIVRTNNIFLFCSKRSSQNDLCAALEHSRTRREHP